MLFSLSFARASSIVIIVGAATCLVTFGAVTFFAPGLPSAVVAGISPAMLAFIFAAVVGLLATSLAGAVVGRHQSREIDQIRTTIDSMT